MRFIPSPKLQPGMIIARDILCTNKSAASMLCRGKQLSDKYIGFLNERGYLGAYISDRISDDVELEETIDPNLFKEGIEAVQDESIGSLINVATNIVSDISSRENVTLDMLDLRSFDDYTYHHSVNVAVFSVVVGKKMGLSNEELAQLSLAGLCHDLGKSRIPLNVLNKPGRLTDEEYELIKRHPQDAYDMLYSNYDVPSIVRQAVLMHHENENGSGYPLGREGNDIPLFAKILHAVDVYDALTSRRPYKDPYSPADAFEYMIGGKGILFNEQVIDVMLSVIPAYPPGIDVLLSNNETALVIGHTDNALRPRIKIDGQDEIINLKTDPRYANVTIVASGIMPSDYVGEIEVLNENRMPEMDRPKNILIVDDTRMSLMQTQRALGNSYNVQGLSSGLELLSYLKSNDAPDLIIMDIEMPILSGLETMKKMIDNGFGTIPVMFLTGNRKRDVVMACKSLGAVDYVMKPAKPVYLQERVAVALGFYRD